MGESNPVGRLRARRDLLASGARDYSIANDVRAGQLSRVVHGWYKTGPASTGDQAIRDRIAAMLHRAPKLTASNESAIVIHGLPLVYSRDTNVQLTRNAVTGARREKGRVVHARPLAEHEVVEIDGLRVTSIGRTLLDLACATPDARTEVGVVIEFDGKIKYLKPLRPGQDVTHVVIDEKAREDALREAGLIVIRVVWADFADPRGLIDRVRRALARGRAAMSAGLVDALFRRRARLGLNVG